MEPKIDKTITTKKGGNIIIPRKIIRSEYPESSSNPGENVIKTSPQNLTDVQKNQARKNQGLYYSTIIEGKTITFDGNIEGKEVVDIGEGILIKVADSPKSIPESALKTIGTFVREQGEEHLYEGEIDIAIDGKTFFPGQSEGNLIVAGSTTLGGMVFIADNFSASMGGESLSLDGIYFSYGDYNDNIRYVTFLQYDDFEEIEKIDSKYLDLSETEALIVKIPGVFSESGFYFGNVEEYSKNVSYDLIVNTLQKGKPVFVAIIANAVAGEIKELSTNVSFNQTEVEVSFPTYTRLRNNNTYVVYTTIKIGKTNDNLHLHYYEYEHLVEIMKEAEYPSEN